MVQIGNRIIMSKKGAEKVILNELGEPMFRRCMNHDCSITQDFSVESKGFVKELTVKIIQKRTVLSERTLEYLTGYFVITYRLKMPKDRELEYIYFKYDPKIMGNVCIRDFNKGWTTTVNVMNEETRKKYGIKQVGKPKRISFNQAKLMVLNRQVLPFEFNRQGEVGETRIF